jgi:hypothetical protein
MTIQGIWIGNWICWALVKRNYKNYNAFANSHTLLLTTGLFKFLCLHQSLPGNGSQKYPLLPLLAAGYYLTNQLMTVASSHFQLSCQVSVTLRPTVSWPISLEVKHHLEPKPRFLLLSHGCGFVDVERPLWREEEPVIYRGQNQCTYHLHLQFYMSELYIVSCQYSGSLRIPTIYSFAPDSSVYSTYVQYI